MGLQARLSSPHKFLGRVDPSILPPLCRVQVTEDLNSCCLFWALLVNPGNWCYFLFIYPLIMVKPEKLDMPGKTFQSFMTTFPKQIKNIIHERLARKVSNLPLDRGSILETLYNQKEKKSMRGSFQT
ncbi:hypothetical protein TorRG33x02_100150 [Trema orientale]|uniref:Uncharacterized protein n=1 Tax=Trema orientale TaxID=63057 RepID=A0A2P5F917_TREOI|nr:hypothetical protein TorRG33x02_100150 [Trema orientale]